MKKLGVNLLLLAISLSILAYLVRDILQNDPATFARLRTEPKQWHLLTAGWLCAAAAVMVGIGRWYLLAGAVGLGLGTVEALRLGLVSYLLSFVFLGPAGGDLVKAFLVARRRPGRRAQSVASVLVDRIVGLYALLLVAAVGIVLVRTGSDDQQVLWLGRLVLMATGVASAILLILGLAPGSARGLAKLSSVIPWAGHRLRALIDAVGQYRQHAAALVAATLLSLVAHALNVVAFYLIARGLPYTPPSLAEHFMIVPLALATGVIPLPMEGLGAFEYVVDYFYRHLGAQVAGRGGLLVVLAYRLVTLAVAGVGGLCYFARRQEVNAALEEAEAIGSSEAL